MLKTEHLFYCHAHNYAQNYILDFLPVISANHPGNLNNWILYLFRFPKQILSGIIYCSTGQQDVIYGIPGMFCIMELNEERSWSKPYVAR